jgi:hypothetical protein
MHHISESVMFHTELGSCITCVQSIPQQTIFLIISGSSVGQFLSYMTNLHQIHSVFIFCSRKDQYERLSFQHSKIIGIYNELDLLYIYQLKNKSILFRSKFVHHGVFLINLNILLKIYRNNRTIFFGFIFFMLFSYIYHAINK